MSPPNLASNIIASTFPIAVIEVPHKYYEKYSKTEMRVASKKMGGATYPSPQRLYLPRWKHIKTIYVFEMSHHNYYQCQSLTNHPHYLLLRSEVEDFNLAIMAFQKRYKQSPEIKRISSNENFVDNFLIVINNFLDFPSINNYVSSINDLHLLKEVISKSKLDSNQGNFKIDCGYSSGKNLEEQNLDEYGVTKPRLLEMTKEPIFLEIQLHNLEQFQI